jgi:hypothetical protein
MTAVAVALVNLLDYRRPVYCADCTVTYGLPFTFMTEGGYVGIRRMLWIGLATDTALALAVGVAAGWAWTRGRA